MRVRRAIGVIIGLVVAMTGMLGRSAGAQDQPPPPPSQEQPEVLTRGPVHEAFAEPVTLENQTGLVVPNQPPADIQEVPPPERPAGDNYVWVPGYWSWDQDRNDYLWVSACWRLAPPNRYWVPGYWSPAAGGWEWVPGFWASAQTQEAQEIEYLPTPPAPFDVEPVGQAPDPDTAWVPGCWYWRDGHYIRRSGYWVRQYADWIWVPSHYRWSPRGYVFVEGHWDYSLSRRGVLFAPVYFPPAIYRGGAYTYSPTICIDTAVLRDSMFVYPRYCHYYFGDYYDERYARVGIVPEFYVERDHVYYDPLYAHERWRFSREDRNWEEHRRQEYERRREDRDLRPAHTYREMETRVARLPEAERSRVELAKPLATVATRNTGPVRYETLKADDRQKITRQAAQTHQFREERGKWESNARPNPAAGRLPAETRAPTPERRDTTAGRAPATPTPDQRERTTPAPEPGVTVPPTVRREPVPEQTTPTPAPERRDTTAGRAPTPTPEERDRTTPAPEPRVPVPAAGRREPVPEQTTPTPMPERRDTTAGRAPATPTPDQRERTTPTPQPRVTVPPSGQRETGPDRTTSERRTPSASAEPRVPSTPQRESHAANPERVQIPRPPVMANPSAAGGDRGSPPPRPTDERQGQDRQDRSDGRDNGQRGDR